MSLTAGSIAGPKNIPAEIVEILHREINACLARLEIKAKYDDLGIRIHAASPADFGELVADETEKWAKRSSSPASSRSEPITSQIFHNVSFGKNVGS